MISVLTHGASNIVLRGSVLFDDGLGPTEIILDSSGYRLSVLPRHYILGSGFARSAKVNSDTF